MRNIYGEVPVVFVSLKGVDGLTFEAAYGMLRRIIRAEASRLRLLLNSEKITEDDLWSESWRTMILLMI